jgi:hypothetical protein
MFRDRIAFASVKSLRPAVAHVVVGSHGAQFGSVGV